MASESSSLRALLFCLAALGAACSGGRPSPPAVPDASTPDPTAVAAPSSPTETVADATAGGTPGGSGLTDPAARPDGADAGAPAADAGIAAADAGVAVVPLSAAVAVVGGQDVPLDRGGGTLIDPAASFRVEIAVPLSDGRLALHDEQDAMVASSGTSEIGTSWTRYRLVPDEPLRPGTSFALRVDGAATREVHDPGGRAYAPVVLTFRTTGERPPPPVPAKKKRAKRRR